MKFILVEEEDKRNYFDLLLSADEQPSMIEKYLGRGTMYALEDGGVKAVCVVTDEGNGTLEIKNIAVREGFRKKGYGRALINFLQEEYRGGFSILQAGTGDSPFTVPFYLSCGFERAHVVKDFFTQNYAEPIYEGGVLLTDMVYFRKRI